MYCPTSKEQISLQHQILPLWIQHVVVICPNKILNPNMWKMEVSEIQQKIEKVCESSTVKLVEN